MKTFNPAIFGASAFVALTAACVVPLAWSEETAVLPEVPESSQEAVPTLTGQISAQMNTTATAGDYFQIAQEPTPLTEYSEREYQAVAITLQNKQETQIELIHGEVANALDEMVLLQQKVKTKTRALKLTGLALRSTSLVPGIGLIGGVAGYSTNLAAARMQKNAFNRASYSVENTATGGQELSGRYVQRFNSIIIPANQTLTFKALMPKDVAPGLRLVFKDLKTNQLYELMQ
jgi:hypothetical protein